MSETESAFRDYKLGGSTGNVSRVAQILSKLFEALDVVRRHDRWAVAEPLRDLLAIEMVQ
jgi:hypothetical protein